MSPSAEKVIERLQSTRNRWWFYSLLTTCALAASISFGLWLLFTCSDAFLRFSQGFLATLFGVWIIVTAWMLWIVGRRLARNQRGLEATARRVESEYPSLGNSLINLVQLTGSHNNGDPAFCEAAINNAAAQTEDINFSMAANKNSRWQRLRHCMQTPRDMLEAVILLSMLIAVAIVCRDSVPNWASAANRFFSPWEFVPTVGSVGVITVTPKDADVLVGSSQDITAAIENPQASTHEARIFIQPEVEAETVQIMTGDEHFQHYKISLPSVLKTIKYRIEIGDSQTPIYTLRTREKPAIAEVTATYRYPTYINRKEETKKQTTADLEGPQYSKAILRIRPTTPIAKGHVLIDGKELLGRIEENGKLMSIEIPLIKNSGYTVHLFNDAGHTDPDPRINRIQIVPDKPPTVELLKPAMESTSAPSEKIPIMIRAGDDYGLGRLRLELKTQGQDNSSTLQQWTDFENSTSITRQYELKLSSEQFKPGQTILVRATAWDKRIVEDWGLDLKPQESSTAWHEIKLVTTEAKTSVSLEEIESLRSSIWKILEKQIRTRVMAAGIKHATQLSVRTSTSNNVRTEQVDIHKTTAGLVNAIGNSDQSERQSIKRALNSLAYDEMLAAVQQCDELAKITILDKFDHPATKLLTTQDRIIDALRKLLDVSRHTESEIISEMRKRPGSDLPDDVKQKLEEARNKLDKFLEQQKKIIESTENLAKTPVEDFTKEQEELLKGLAAAEDDWAKFMKDLHSDLSKLPEQDFANSTMVKESVEIQTEIKMAEDALLKKSADIAVPLEQLGYEMAEELKTNLEKWLPDTPDREKWSQEESLTDKDKEAPMAELPGELEDLVGELMEQESDLFDEMEDVSSSAADSLDKGAGWDAMDGPISNMSAKGVTGNRLPNTSEIGGRSGEGRQGKSSGEFVGDEAVGKGGRKTPTRLTPDPYMAGQIKDHSKQSAGGATGGGKESGKGGEGLEGPAPRTPSPRDMQRLAGKQAAIRNKAETVDLQFQVANFQHTDLKKMIEVMSQIELDLKSGRYQNALRQRQVLLDGMGNVKQYLQGEYEVRKDTTINLPTDIQKEILGGMKDPSPRGWEELNRQYFDHLSTGSNER